MQIVRSHRRKFPIEELEGSPGLLALCVLLRLAVVLHRDRAENTLPAFWVAPTGAGEIWITFPRKWLAEHPLTKLDLEQESEYLSVIPLRLTVTPSRSSCGYGTGHQPSLGYHWVVAMRSEIGGGDRDAPWVPQNTITRGSAGVARNRQRRADALIAWQYDGTGQRRPDDPEA